jgi:hypothetical protein
MMSNRQRQAIVLGETAMAIVLFAIVPPIAQPANYHQFADAQSWFGIPRALNVLSNLAFLIVGCVGIFYLFSNEPSHLFIQPRERLPYAVLFTGVVLTFFGSSYYHLAPDNARLVWDRLPMTLGFMGLMSAIMCERISLKVGLRLLPLLLLFGVLSVCYWYWTETHGRGDLRPYLFVQFFPGLAIPLIIWLYPARYTGSRELGFAALFYVLAKLLEAADRRIYDLTGQIISGHTLKHLAAAWAVWWILRMLQTRRVHPTFTSGDRAAAFHAT